VSETRPEVTTQYGISDKAADGFGGGVVKIRYYESGSRTIDLQMSKPALLLNSSEAIMLAKALLDAAMPSEEVFWPTESGDAA
jgi:hypothetical protein